MSVGVEISGQQGGISSVVRNTHVNPFKTSAGLHNGLLTLTKPFQEFAPGSVAFSNPSLGVSMNQAVTFGGSPELIFDGTGVGGWSDSTTSGAEWNVADGGKVTLDHGPHNSFALFEDPTTPVDSDDYTALSGKVDLDNYSPATQDLLINFTLAGVQVGSQVGLNSFIDTGDFTEQSFVISLSEFNLSNSDIDGLQITVERTGGHQPHVAFDDFQLEETGTPIVFTVEANGHDLHVTKLRFMFIDNVTGSSAMTYNKILSLNRLPNGFDVRIVKDGAILASATIRQISGFIFGGSDVVLISDDGTNTLVGLDLILATPVVLKSGHEQTDFISITINDDMSGLLEFNALAGAKQELINGE